MSRSVAQFLRDTAVSKSAQRNYRRQAAWLRTLAHEQLAIGAEQEARRTRYYASMAEHAAQNKYFDEEPR